MEPELKLKNIWFVDDDEITNEVNKRLCELSGFGDKITCFTSATEALNNLSNITGLTNIPELIFLDMNMPKINGLEFIDQINFLSNLSGYTRIIILTANYKKDLHERIPLTQTCVIDIILKPLTSDTLSDIAIRYQLK